ncbi:MAG: acyl-CoA dehydratase activase [Lachnospira sp.]
MKYKIKEIFDPRYADYNLEKAAVGIDIGSRGSKAVLIYKGELYTQMVLSGISSKQTAKELFEKLIEESGISTDEVVGIVGTGYGSVAMDFGNIPFNPVTEITCHALGAHYLNVKTKTVIDIGGQDSKAIKVNTYDGKVVDFVMNDKCAAGTGRFLEKVAQILELKLDELGPVAVKSEKPCDISSQCVVFAESEIISLRATGAKKEDIAYGVHLATARRVRNLLRRTGFEPDILFTGGVNNNIGMIKALEQILGEKIVRVKLDTMYAGALGAALTAASK